MNRFVRSALVKWIAATAVALFVGGAVGGPVANAARGDQAPSVAVFTLDDSAGAPAAAVSSLSSALYSAVAASGRFRAVGSGPLPLVKAINGDPFGAALEAAAKAGATQMLLGDLVKIDGGRAYYRLEAYRVDPLAPIRIRMFSQAYPSKAGAAAAEFASNLAALEATRTTKGTIWSLSGGVHADLGSAEGFALGDRFNVMRNGQKVAEAQITKIESSDATLAISGAASGYAPAVGDELVGASPAPAIPPPAKGGSGFNPLALAVAAAAALLAIGHGGQGQSPIIFTSPSPGSSGAAFTVGQGLITTGGGQFNPVIQWTFSKPVAQSAATLGNSLAFISVSQSNDPQGPRTLAVFCGCTPTFDSTATILTINVGAPVVPIVSGTTVTFTFNSAITDTATPPDNLQPSVQSHTFSVASHPLAAPKPLQPQPGSSGSVTPAKPGPSKPAPGEPRTPREPR